MSDWANVSRGDEGEKPAWSKVENSTETAKPEASKAEEPAPRNFDRPPQRQQRRQEPREQREPKAPSCYDFGRTGSCRRANCPFSHVEGQGGVRQRDNNRGGRGGDRECFTFRDTGDCKFGDECRFSHGGQGGNGGSSRDSGYGGRSSGFGGGFRSGGFSRGPKVCYDFRDNGSCRFGDDCSYSHESR